MSYAPILETRETRTSTRHRHGRRLAAALAVAAAGAVTTYATPAEAIPAFARKYGTSCQTCHLAFPKLTPFGEAFRRNGFRFPAGGDEEVSEEEPLELGRDAYKKMFPDSVWPGEIPGTLPVSFGLQSGVSVTEGEAAHHHGSTPAIPAGHDHDAEHADWGAQIAGSEVSFLAGGTLGDTISFFAKVEVSGGDHSEIIVERPHLVFQPFGEPSLNLRVGAFAPGIHPFSVHRNLAGHNMLYTTVSAGDNGWAPEPEQVGVEANGVFARRLGYAVGVVEGGGNDPNRAKDFYGRLEYKLGGLGLDGSGQTGMVQPWQEKSLTVGAFVYTGFATFSDPAGSGLQQSEHFTRTGGDVSVGLGDLTAKVAGFYQMHERPVFMNPYNGSLTGSLAQVDYVVWPWLVPTLRYEVFRQDLPDMNAQNGHRVTAVVNALVRANLVVRAIGMASKNPGTDLEASQFSIIAGTAF